MSAKKPEWIGAAELVEALKVDRRTITRWVKGGCPHRRRGGGKRAPLEFLLVEVKAWMRKVGRTGDRGRPAEGLEPDVAPRRPPATGGGGEDEDDDATPWYQQLEESDDDRELIRRVNLELKREDLRRKRRENEAAEGATVPLTEVRQAWGAQVEIVQARFRALPALLAQRLVGRSYEEMHDLLEDEFRTLLLAFARDELVT